MRRVSVLFGTAAILAIVSSATVSQPASGSRTESTLSFASSPAWLSMGLGNAQNVCLNESYPANCPDGATLYGYGGSGWLADLSSIPGATWIWVPYITGEVSPAENSEFIVAKSLSIPGTPTGGTLSVAVDDMAIVFVNGSLVGTWGSITDVDKAAYAANNLKTFDISPYLVGGQNTVKIKIFNGPVVFAGCVGHCTYAVNPAGVVFGGSVTYEG
jgi:hypothetical protein